MRLTFKEAQEVIRKQKLWVWRQENWKREIAERKSRRWRYLHEDSFDADLEETGFQYPGAAGDYFEVPNR